MNQALVGGLLTGSVIALVAYGYHLTWITTRTVNFAQGPLLMVGGMAAYVCVSAGLPYGLAVLFATLAGGMTGILVERLAIAPLVGRLSHSWVLSTFGVGVMLQAAAAKIWGLNPLPVDSALDVQPVTILGARLTQQDLLMVTWTVCVIAVIAICLKRTMLGKAVRAVAANRRAAALGGISPVRISLLAYALSAMTTAGLGALLAASSGVSFNTGAFLGFQAFFAAMLGGMESSLGVVVGGIVVGVVASVIAWYNPLLQDGGVLILIVIALAFRPFGVFGKAPVERV